MKLLFCTRCGDIISPHREDMKPRWCQCNGHAVWWVDGQKGILRVHDRYGENDQAYVLGINNNFLMYRGELNAAAVKEIHEACPDDYLFKQWGTPFIRIRPGRSRDTAWESNVPTAEQAV